MKLAAGAPARHAPLIDSLWVPGSMARPVRLFLLALGGSLLLTLSAKVLVPFFPVHMTMQTFTVLVIGMAFGPRLGAATVALYLMQGALGLPVFTGTPEKGLGLAYMMGPTGGFLIGFLVAAWVVGALAERGWDRSFAGTAGAVALANGCTFALGVAYLTVLFDFERAIAFGVAPFVYSEALKMALAVAVMPLAWSLMRRIGR